jgi:oxaloacetate decarboxylase alpha subunit
MSARAQSDAVRMAEDARSGPIRIVDTTMRDGQQCLWATRMSTAMMLPVAERMDQAGFDAIELVGAVQFDAAVRYLKEDPWERLRLIRQRIRRTPLQALIRSKCVLGFDLQPDDISNLWVERLVANGIRRFVAFDGLHDLDNLVASLKHAKALGAYTTGWLTFSDSPVHTDELYVLKAREFIDRAGVDAVMIEDASGILTPERARTLVPKLKQAIGPVSLGLHSHGLLGLPQRTYLEAVALGVDNLYTCIPPLADANAPPSVLTTVQNLRYRGFDVGVDVATVEAVAAHFEAVAARDDKPRGRPMDFDASSFGHQIPGGVLSNLTAQLKAAGLAHKLPEVLEECSRVRAELGWPIQVTPFAQLIGVQATLNVIRGERYAVVPDEVKKYALGYYGKLLAPVDPDVLDRIIANGSQYISREPRRPEPALPALRKRYPGASDDELLLRHSFDPAIVDAMLQNKPDYAAYGIAEKPILHLLREIATRPPVNRVAISKGDLSIELKR